MKRAKHGMLRRTESSVPPFKSEFVKIMTEIGSRCCKWRARSGLQSHSEKSFSTNCSEDECHSLDYDDCEREPKALPLINFRIHKKGKICHLFTENLIPRLVL